MLEHVYPLLSTIYTRERRTCQLYCVLPQFIFNQIRSCVQYKITLVQNSTAVIVAAITGCPVINQLSKNVSKLPTKRQVIAFTKLRELRSFNTHFLADISSTN